MTDSAPYSIDQLLGTLTEPTCEYKLRIDQACGDMPAYLLVTACGCTVFVCDADYSRIEAMMEGGRKHLVCKNHMELGPLDREWRRL